MMQTVGILRACDSSFHIENYFLPLSWISLTSYTNKLLTKVLFNHKRELLFQSVYNLKCYCVFQNTEVFSEMLHCRSKSKRKTQVKASFCQWFSRTNIIFTTLNDSVCQGFTTKQTDQISAGQRKMYISSESLSPALHIKLSNHSSFRKMCPTSYEISAMNFQAKRLDMSCCCWSIQVI